MLLNKKKLKKTPLPLIAAEKYMYIFVLCSLTDIQIIYRIDAHGL